MSRPPCPERIGMPEGPDHCKLESGACLLETDGHCHTYADYLIYLRVQGKEGKID